MIIIIAISSSSSSSSSSMFIHNNNANNIIIKAASLFAKILHLAQTAVGVSFVKRESYSGSEEPPENRTPGDLRREIRRGETGRRGMLLEQPLGLGRASGCGQMRSTLMGPLQE